MKGFGIPVGTLAISGGAAGIAVLTGLLATFAGAYWPARRAGRIAPIRAVLGERATASIAAGSLRALAGVALFVPGAVFGGSLWMSNNTNGALNGMHRDAADDGHVRRHGPRRAGGDHAARRAAHAAVAVAVARPAGGWPPTRPARTPRGPRLRRWR